MHCVTNLVVTGFTANVLLGRGRLAGDGGGHRGGRRLRAGGSGSARQRRHRHERRCRGDARRREAADQAGTPVGPRPGRRGSLAIPHRRRRTTHRPSPVDHPRQRFGDPRAWRARADARRAPTPPPTPPTRSTARAASVDTHRRGRRRDRGGRLRHRRRAGHCRARAATSCSRRSPAPAALWARSWPRSWASRTRRCRPRCRDRPSSRAPASGPPASPTAPAALPSPSWINLYLIGTDTASAGAAHDPAVAWNPELEHLLVCPVDRGPLEWHLNAGSRSTPVAPRAIRSGRYPHPARRRRPRTRRCRRAPARADGPPACTTDTIRS